jgi:hypothetical protein
LVSVFDLKLNSFLNFDNNFSMNSFKTNSGYLLFL